MYETYRPIDGHRGAQPSLHLHATPPPQAYAHSKAVQVCRQQCFAHAARAVYGPAKDDALFDAFVVQTMSSVEGLDACSPSLDESSIAYFRCLKNYTKSPVRPAFGDVCVNYSVAMIVYADHQFRWPL